jgi:DNA-binding MarR family transcriptional regulator
MIRAIIQQGAFSKFQKKVGRNSFTVYLVLVACSPDGEQVEMSLSTLTQLSGLSESTLSTTINKLESKKLVTRLLGGKSGTSQVYQLHQGSFKKVMK